MNNLLVPLPCYPGEEAPRQQQIQQHCKDLAAKAAEIVAPAAGPGDTEESEPSADLGVQTIAVEAQLKDKILAFKALTQKTQVYAEAAINRVSEAGAAEDYVNHVELVTLRLRIFNAVFEETTTDSPGLFGIVQSLTSKQLMMLPVSRPAESVKTIGELEQALGKLFEVTDSDELDAQAKRLSGALNVLHQVQQSVIAASKDLEKTFFRRLAHTEHAKKMVQRQAEARERAGAKKRARQAAKNMATPASVPAKAGSVFDVVAPKFCTVMDGERHADRPWVQEACGDLRDLVEDMKGTFTLFAAQFTNSLQCKLTNRAQCPMKGNPQLTDMVRKTMMKHVDAEPLEQVPDSISMVSVAGFDEKMRWCGCEYLGAASLRFTVSGTRRLLCMPFAGLKHVVGGPMSSFYERVPGMLGTEEQGEELLERIRAAGWVESRIYMPDLGPNSLVFIPPAYICMEQTLNRTKTISLRTSFLGRSDDALVELVDAMMESDQARCVLQPSLWGAGLRETAPTMSNKEQRKT